MRGSYPRFANLNVDVVGSTWILATVQEEHFYLPIFWFGPGTGFVASKESCE